MNNSLSVNRILLTFGIPLAILGFLIFLTQSTWLNKNDTLSLAITLDLLLTVPLVYFLMIRKTDIPKTTVVPVMIVGLLIGTYCLPKDNQTYLKLFRTWVLPLIELGILTYVVSKVYVATKKYKSIKGTAPDFFSALRSTCAEILPKKLVYPFATEVAVIYYGFFSWKNKSLAENEFSYHKKSGSSALLGAFILILIAETFAFHFLLAYWSHVVAWIVTALSIYTLIQLFGLARSLSKRPVVINEQTLTLRYGFLNEVDIPFSDIDNLELSRKPLEKDKLNIKLSPLGELESHNMIIRLKKEHKLVGFYGIKKQFTMIGFHIDQAALFKQKMENALATNSLKLKL